MALIAATPSGRKYQTKGTFKIPDNADYSWAHPVIANGKLYLRGNDKMLCYDIKAK
jgi:outer membrane protein assembly factor BamB